MADLSSINFSHITKQAMAQYGFYSRFTNRVFKETDRIKSNIREKSKSTTKDLSSLLWSSIDNIDSLDLDQLEYCERTSRNEIRVLIAIADVDSYVEKGSAIDRHARHNATSVYTGFEIFPMLPEKLSTDLSSLKAEEDRLAVVVEFFVREDGSLRAGEVNHALVNNKAKLVYEEIGDWLEEKTPLPETIAVISGLKEQLLLQEEASRRLKEFRNKSGALELETIESVPLIKDGRVVDLVVKSKNKARYIIENFMISANTTIMQFLEKRKQPIIQRVLPEPEHWPRIRDLAESLGETLPSMPDSLALSQFLQRQHEKNPLGFSNLSISIVKLLGAAQYIVFDPGKEKIGHFGLAVQDYVHSTAPNRRYIDIVIQRIVKAALSQTPVSYTRGELNDIAAWASDRVLAAKRVERFMRKVAASVLLMDRIGEIFDGIVTGASEKGVYVRLFSPPVEGRVMRGERGLVVGEKIKVRLKRMIPERGYIDFERYSPSGLPPRFPQIKLRRKKH